MKMIRCEVLNNKMKNIQTARYSFSELLLCVHFLCNGAKAGRKCHE